MSKIIIVGAGIVGLSTARAARHRGHEVVLIDRRQVPNPQGASWDAHRMIRPHYGAATGYTRMVQDAFAAWDREWNDIGRDHHHQSGAIAIGVRQGDYAHQTLDVFEREAIRYRRLDRASLAKLCPQYKLPAEAFGVLTQQGGPLFADRIVTDLAALVRSMGVEVIELNEVIALDEQAATITLADRTIIEGDAVVIAAGAWLGRLIPEYADLPVMRQALVYVRPPVAYADAWQAGPALAAFGDHGGYTLPGVRGTELKFGNGPHRRRADPEVDGFEVAANEPQRIIHGFSDILHDIDDYEPLRTAVGYYVMDASRRFRIETRGRALVVTNCDGQMFKFGPLVGERVIASIDGEIAAQSLRTWAQGQ